MSSRDSHPRRRAYLLGAFVAALFAIVGTWQDALPRLEQRSRDSEEQRKLALAASPSANKTEDSSVSLESQSLPASADYKDALNAGPSAAALGGAPLSAAWAPATSRIPLPAPAAFSSAVKAAARSPAKESRESLLHSQASTSGDMAAEQSSSLAQLPRGNPASNFSVQQSRDDPDRHKESLQDRNHSGLGASERKAKMASQSSWSTQGLWAAARRNTPNASAPNQENQGSARRLKHRPLLRRRHEGPLKPPKISRAPSRNPWEKAIPKTLPDGSPLDAIPPATLAEIEVISQPPQKLDHLKSAHWHEEGTVKYYHDGPLWGRWADGHWTWLEREQGRWWLWADSKDPVLLWHQGHWWWQSRGTWFVLHNNDAWVYRYLTDWRQDGLVHQDGSQMIFSPDGARVGIIEPKLGARVYDSETGQQQSILSEEDLPRASGPQAPTRLTFPR